MCKAQILLTRLRKSKTAREAGADAEGLLARVRAVESRIAEADRDLESAPGRNGADRTAEAAIASLRTQNGALREKVISMGDRYELLRRIVGKRRKVAREGKTAVTVGGLIDALDRRRVRANRDVVARGRAELENEIAQFYAEQKRLAEGIAAARAATPESEDAVVREIAQLRAAVAGLRLK
jgi:hypothetical protein